MDLNYAPDDLAFRDTVRTWIAAKLPKDLQHKVLNHKRLQREDYARWHKIVYQQGWVTGPRCESPHRRSVVCAFFVCCSVDIP